MGPELVSDTHVKRVVVITLMPELIADSLKHGVLGKALQDGLIEVVCVNPRDFAHDRHRTVDDKPYGGGPGMVMMVEPLKLALGSSQASMPSARA